MGSNSHDALGSHQLQGFWPLTRPLLTNRMTELVTYGSVGGGGSNPAPYPAVDAPIAHLSPIVRLGRRTADQHRSPIPCAL
jgi:hypothetical protein